MIELYKHTIKLCTDKLCLKTFPIFKQRVKFLWMCLMGKNLHLQAPLHKFIVYVLFTYFMVNYKSFAFGGANLNFKKPRIMIILNFIEFEKVYKKSKTLMYNIWELWTSVPLNNSISPLLLQHPKYQTSTWKRASI